MTLGVATALRNASLNAIRDAIDGGVAEGEIKFYTGTRPATGGALSGNTLLGIVNFSDPCAPDAVNGVLTFNSFTDDDNADNTGQATWARITDSEDTFVADVDVGTSGADINLNSVDINQGGIIRVTSGTLTAGNA